MREIKFKAWSLSCNYWISTETANQKIKFYAKEVEVAIIQYTGLNDKNGTEIYNSDICRFKHGEFEDTKECHYVRGCYGFNTSLGFIRLGEIQSWDIEVVGNAYEKKELSF